MNAILDRRSLLRASGALLLHTASGLQKISSAEVSVRPAAAPTPT